MLSYAWIAGIGATVAAGWQQIKGLFTRFSNLLIVEITVQNSVNTALWIYLVKNAKMSPFSDYYFYTDSMYVRPEKDYQHILFQSAGRNTTFWYKWRPISVSGMGSMGSSDAMKITFFRGTFNISQILIDALDEFNVFMKEGRKQEDGILHRYSVKKIFGTFKKNAQGGSKGGGGYDQDVAEKSEGVPEISKSSSGGRNTDWDKCFKWKREELGVPISKKPFENLSYDTKALEILNEIKRWYKSKDWFKAKGLDWRMACGFGGKPGTGKTSMVRAIGQELDLPIHIYDLTTMTNEELSRKWTQSINSAPLIILFEDFDRLFTENREFKAEGLTLDVLLNCIAGVEPSDGVLLIVTANDVSKIDTAMGIPEEGSQRSTRPGRIDRWCWFGNLTEDNRRYVAGRILSECPELIEKTVKEGDGETGAQFKKRCETLALKMYWDNKIEPVGDVTNKPLHQELFAIKKLQNELSIPPQSYN